MTREEFQTERTRIISEMLDNPDEYGIYPTTKCFEQLDALFDSLSLPPAEGAEAIVKKYEDEYDFKFHWVQRDRVIRMMREFAAQQQPTAEGAEEIDDETIAWAAEHQCGTPFSERWVGFVKGAKWHRSLHAQRIAEKMVEEGLREELFKFFEYEHAYTPKYLNSGHVITEYLKTRDSHE